MTLIIPWLLTIVMQNIVGPGCCSQPPSPSKNMNNISYTNVSHLLQGLLGGYDIRLRPGFGGEALQLAMDILIASFDSISEVNMDYTITMYLHQYWKDDRLAWSNVQNNESMTLSGEFSKKIWVPDTFLANDKHSFLHDVTETNKMLRLYSDGFIAYGMRFTSTLACNMNLRHYPLDRQNCTVEIESYGYTTSEVFMQWRGGPAAIKGVKDAEIPQFSIQGHHSTSSTVTTATGSYQRLSLIFMLERNIGYFIFQTYLPCILIVMLSWVSFWINHEATSARVALGITTVLTMTTISTGVRQSLPRISYVKSIDIYLVMCFVFVFAALLEYAAVNYSYWGNRAKQKARAQVAANKDVPDPEDSPIGQEKTGWMDITTFQERMEERDHQASGEEYGMLMSDQGGSKLSQGRISPLPSLRSRDPLYQRDPLNHVTNLSEPIQSCPATSPPPNYPRLKTSSVTGPSKGLRFRGKSTRSLRGSQTNSLPSRRSRIFQQMKRKAKSAIPRIRDVNVIDKYSRVIFPGSFILFNLFYWSYYTVFARWYY